ncbi:hypothetical protein [Alicyclobacillus macrosporangiidus]|uniref:hypothetical protein n=1 Tax=Alicyclobacillus macrosporangiidus TaxID=392015 RepID=UPI000A76EAC5|nr:hypothetical protein [Alicyclobacillus macrosporangiidus]MCL6598886.1 hypothetical protein [Alicyclobacillus macrosporangiidus]
MKRIFLSAFAALSLLTANAPFALANTTHTSTTTSQTSSSGTYTPDSTLPIVVE